MCFTENVVRHFKPVYVFSAPMITRLTKQGIGFRCVVVSTPTASSCNRLLNQLDEGTVT